LRAPQLNALASRFARGTRRGEVLLNGARFLERDFREFGVYVMQAEPLLATATVRPPRRRPCLLARYMLHASTPRTRLAGRCRCGKPSRQARCCACRCP